MKTRYRACEECQRRKIKCEASEGEGPCESCKRHNLECKPAAPRFQRDRIAELERQVADLKRALEEQSPSPSQSVSSLPISGSAASASLRGGSLRRRTVTPQLDGGGGGLTDEVLFFLDLRVPLQAQEQALRTYAANAGAAWPVVRLSEHDLGHVRETAPLLLLSVIAFAVPAGPVGISTETQDELAQETMRILGREVVRKGRRSLGTVQALLVAAFWARSPPPGDEYGSSYQLVQLASDMAIDLGIAGPTLLPTPAAYFSRIEDPSSLEARRTWLACFLATASSSISTRRPPSVPWTQYHEACLVYLESGHDPLDALLCQHVRVNKLIQDAANQLGLCDLAQYLDPNTAEAHWFVGRLSAELDVWASGSAAALLVSGSPVLRLWRHLALVRIHEIVLHTPTNKALFAAPYIPDHVLVKDFPAPPLVTPVVAHSLDALVDACHGVIYEAMNMDPSLFFSMPAYSFTPAIPYICIILMDVLVATTSPGNSYGPHVRLRKLRIEETIEDLQRLRLSLEALDPTASSWTTRFIGATQWLNDWYVDYMAIVRRYEENLTTEMMLDLGVNSYTSSLSPP